MNEVANEIFDLLSFNSSLLKSYVLGNSKLRRL